MDQDQEHLRLLAISHRIVGGLLGLAACLPLIHLALGIALVTGRINAAHRPDSVIGGILFIVFGILAIAIGWTLAVLVLLTGRWLSERRRYNFCLVVAAVECMFMPIGTVLGVLTLVVLLRPSVKALFDPGRPTV
ncbi:MAG TPA: hypothetical protein VMF30_04870 [Pirellulales bacterium]|nr:hypothetical protein [Pirellulales bacterium]